jgi:hypothetical protein
MWKVLYVNCWHMNDYDSAAMWSVYASRGSGIAITSSYDSLQESLQSDKTLFGGKIIYSDYASEIVDLSNIIMAAAMRKRRSFDFEREFRIVFWDDSIINEASGLTEVANKLASVDVPSGLEVPCVA